MHLARADSEEICVLMKPLFHRNTLCISRKSGEDRADISRKMPTTIAYKAAKKQKSRPFSEYRNTACFFKSVSCQHYVNDALPVQHSGYYASGRPASELGLLFRVKVPITPMGAAHLLYHIYHHAKRKSRTFCELFISFAWEYPYENVESDEVCQKNSRYTRCWALPVGRAQYLTSCSWNQRASFVVFLTGVLPGTSLMLCLSA